MRPSATDIAAPEFPSDLPWVNVAFLRMEKLLGAGTVLVHFWDFAQLNSLRALPYLRAWHDRYRETGLRVIGVHSPRHPFARSEQAVRDAVARLAIEHAVVIDSDFAIWRDYGNEGWPSLFLWDRSGALRFLHFGEGEYLATEQAIQEVLAELDPRRPLPSPLEPMRETDAPGALVATPTPEILPGGSLEAPWQPAQGNDSLRIPYEAAGAYAAADGLGELTVTVDDDAEHAKTVPVAIAGLYQLASNQRHERHTLHLTATPGLRIYAISFAPGLAGPEA